ncbi:hypothetical protein G7Y89_g1078 [Cudoniella acicularis]|uniref:Uncharacterized protein n=1 Tax=Cudoniella acicularis TaxID=354080 RepID=A0A8H4RVZ8_9HELO|nr:hypothetical protein G7Y89_g1078 [Cudoniella acicularis]
MEQYHPNASWCPAAMDNSFGPSVINCRGNFDFTLVFEESILSIVPSTFLFIAGPLRLVELYGGPKKVRHGSFQFLKLANALIYFALQVYLLINWTRPTTLRTQLSVVAAFLSVFDAVSIGMLSFYDHTHSVRPSAILQIYLSTSLLFDIARARTLWLAGINFILAKVFTAGVIAKALLLCLEMREKRNNLNPPYRNLVREATSGFANLRIFWWLVWLLKTGARKIISLNDLDAAEEEFHSERLQTQLQSSWDQDSPKSQSVSNAGYAMIGAYFLVFFSAAISTGHYSYETLRVATKIRGGLITLIYLKSQDLHITFVNESAASTLMSVDVERIAQSLQFLHQLWATPIELVLAVWLLERQLGVACIMPVILALGTRFKPVVRISEANYTFSGCSAVPMFLSSRIRRSQGIWLAAIQSRLNSTATMLGSIKGLKMVGLENYMLSFIQRMRIDEIKDSLQYRKLLVSSIVLSEVTNTLAPVVTFALFTILAKVRNQQVLLTAQAFTSLTIMSLIGTPLLIFVQIVPQIISAVTCFARIQEFLTSESRQDSRFFLETSPATNHLSSQALCEFPQLAEVELAEFKVNKVEDNTAISILNGSFGWTKSQTVVKDVNFKIQKGSTAMIIGPVGSGKSTLVKALLGETRLTNGVVSISSPDIAFCDQKPWLVNGTLRENIIGISEFDEAWYNTVVEACALSKDIHDLPGGDGSILGSNGESLSGGQKHRVAIARAVYSRKNIAIFDDVLSGLDAATEEHVITHVFGHRGLLRKLRTTVVFVTHKVHRMEFADHIIALGISGTITEQGSFSQLKSSGGYVTQILHDKRDIEKEQIEKESMPSTKGNVEPPSETVDTMAQGGSNRQSGDLAVYKYYFQASSWKNVVFASSMAVASAFCVVFSTFWLQKWVKHNANASNDNGFYLGVYVLLGVAAMVSLWLFCRHFILIMVPRSGRKLHERILLSTLRAPLSFFTTTDTGNIINRFSQDMQLIDSELESMGINTLEGLVTLVMRLIIVCISATYIAAVIPFGLATVYLIQRYYLRTSRQLRLLDIEAKAPLYSQFLETLGGLATIRAFGWEASMQQRNHTLLDASQKPFYLLACIQRWLTFALDILTAFLALLVVIFAITVRDSTSGGKVGVALINIVSANQALTMLIICWTGLETSIGAVSRIRDYSEQTPSELRPSVEPLPNGDGKSSLILCLLQMLHLEAGTITIDGINLSTTSIQDVRSRITTVGQDPIFIEGTLRLNMDPKMSQPDDTIIKALTNVQLWDLIRDRGGLDARCTDVHFSRGQQQLFCLARAIVSNSKILLFDEATSSMDTETNKIVQKLIRSEFKEHTVISVEHNLDNILDYDKVALFDTGNLVEFDAPVERDEICIRVAHNYLAKHLNTVVCEVSSAFTLGGNGHRQEERTLVCSDSVGSFCELFAVSVQIEHNQNLEIVRATVSKMEGV